ncbi:hypothetical protein U1Q18_020840 [Sarracenia purpurea var. burkii]
MRVALQVMRQLFTDREVELRNKMDAIQQDLEKEELENLEEMNNILVVKKRKTNEEFQEAHKELINGIRDSCHSNSSVRVKRIDELGNTPLTAAKRKYEGAEAEDKAIELYSLCEAYIRDPNWHPF